MTNILVLAVAAAMIFGGLFGVLYLAFGGRIGSKNTPELADRLRDYAMAKTAALDEHSSPTSLGTSKLAERTVGLADRYATERGFSENLQLTLSAAAVNLRPGEWMILHLLSTVGVGVAFAILSGFGLFAGMLGLGLGFGLPYGFLSYRRAKRRKEFYAALPDMLQMVAGSLSAGHSLPQAFDAVAAETSGPMADELGRALVEVRLGADLETALEAVSDRMQSTDMAWVVMAIRIQRDVGGNLAEILTTVSQTLRERERLRRHVGALSAEGRLSGVILGGLPIVVAIFVSFTNPGYLAPLLTTPAGIALLVVGLGLYVAGIFWMRSTVRVEV